MIGDIIHIPFPNIYRTNKQSDVLKNFIQLLENSLKKKDVAAVLTEAGIITGWGSTYVAPDGYLTEVRRLTKKYGTLLILDEVGTGFSRCGKLFGMQLENVTPDIVTFAKGFSNGVEPIGAMVTTVEIANKTFDKTNIYSTFGWNPMACAAALKTISLHVKNKVWEKANKDGDYLKTTLRDQLNNNPFVGDIRGIGMEIGVDFVTDKSSKKKNSFLLKKIISKCQEKGLHVISDNESNLQLMPPLTINRKLLNNGIEIFIKAVKSLS